MLFLPRGERGEGFSGLSVVCHGELVTSEHLLAIAEASQGKVLGTQASERRERERELRVLRVKKRIYTYSEF